MIANDNDLTLNEKLNHIEGLIKDFDSVTSPAQISDNQLILTEKLQTMEAKLEGHEEKINQLIDVINHLKPITWKYIGEAVAPKNPGEFSLRHSTKTSVEIHDKSVNGVYWEPGNGREDDIFLGESIMGIFNQDGELEIAATFSHVECSRKGKPYTAVTLDDTYEDHKLEIGRQYMINLPGMLPQTRYLEEQAEALEKLQLFAKQRQAQGEDDD